MRSLRFRLFLLLIAATALVWSAAAVWTYLSTRADVQRVLDRRLIEAAGMVASLVQNGDGAVQRPLSIDTPAMTGGPSLGYARQLSCQIWTLDWRLVGRSRDAPSVPLARGQAGFSERSIEGEPWRVYTLIEPRLGLRVLVGDNLRVRRNLVSDVLTGLLLPAIAGLVALGLLIWSAVDRGLLPVRRVARELASRNPSDTQPLAFKQSDTELRPLVDAINGLFVRLDHLRSSERHFIASAAHELQTPLAGLRAHAQIAVSATDGAIRERSLMSIQASVDRTSRLVQQLLDLSREEAEAEPPKPAWISLGRCVRTIGEEFVELLRKSDVELVLDPSARDIEIFIDEAALALALRNLIKNAIEHSPRTGTVHVCVRDRAEQVVIAVTDEGAGIPSSEIPIIRQRFVRGSRTRTAGSGLGLSIVELVLDRVGATLEIENRAEGGMKAAMSFPAPLVRTSQKTGRK